MSYFDQQLLGLHDELIVDLFAGWGGASLGIEMGLGRQVDVAINHDANAISLHEANHPHTKHYVSDVFEVDPREVAKGRPIGLLWASPDCTYHSKARGAKPIRSKHRRRRSLAWVMTRWAGQVGPRVILGENVEEFSAWGPLVGPPDELRPDPKRRGETFRKWVRSLERLGYVVDWQELRACDYGAPTTRKRLFMIARRDGREPVWPEPTHGPGTGRPYPTAADCIDWSEPMLSIFATPEQAKAWARATGRGVPRRPLADATCRRIARGVVKFILEAEEPYVVDGVAPFMVPRYGERDGQEPRILSLNEPHPVVVPTANGGMLVAAFLAKHYGGVVGQEVGAPLGTVTTVDHHGLVVASLVRPEDARAPVIAAFLTKFYGQGVGQWIDEPAATVTTKDRLGLVTVTIAGEPWVIVDVAMRMLTPRELFRVQGFHDGYVIDRGHDGRRFTKRQQVGGCGNSVSPHVAAALGQANCPELIARPDVQRWVA